MNGKNYNQTKELLKSPEVKVRFKDVLGSEREAQAFLASVLGSVYTNNNLAECDPNSILYAAMKAAILNLPIDPNLGQAFIIPYKGRAQFQIGYKGIIQLALRTNNYLVLNATEIYEGEVIVQNRLTGTIILNGKRTSDKIIGYCGYFKMKSGYEHYLYMTIEELIEHAKRYSKAWKVDDSLWHTDFDVMSKKTVLKLLLTRYGELRINAALSDALEEDNKLDNVIEATAVDVTEEEKKEPVTRKRKPRAEVATTNEAAEPSTPPEPESPSDEELWDEDEVPAKEEPAAEETNQAPIYLQLVASGYFTSETMAKTALRFYTGNMDWKSVEPWAIRTVKHLYDGLRIDQAAAKANQE